MFTVAWQHRPLLQGVSRIGCLESTDVQTTTIVQVLNPSMSDISRGGPDESGAVCET